MSDLASERKAAYTRLRTSRRNHETTRYKVCLQWRRPGGCRPGADPTDFRSWRVFAAIPILFYTEKEAWDYIEAVGIFRNITGRKASASVERVTLKRRPT